jgi:hypothetical protein
MFYINKNTWDKIQGYAKIAYTEDKCEIGGMMVMKKDKDGDYHIFDPTILQQTVSGTKCTLDKEALAEHYCRANTKHGAGTRHVWWHSHHMMGVGWSKIDTDTIEETRSADFTVSLVVNLKGEYNLRVQYFEPVMCSEDVELVIIGDEPVITKDMKSEYKELVEMEPVSVYKTNHLHHGSTVNNSQVQTTIFNDTPSTQHSWMTVRNLIDEVDALNADFVTGALTYGDWMRNVRELNKQLQSVNSPIKVKELKKTNLTNFVMTNEASDMIFNTDTKKSLSQLGYNSYSQHYYGGMY